MSQLSELQDELERTDHSNPGTAVFIIAALCFLVALFTGIQALLFVAILLVIVARFLWVGRIGKLRSLERQINQLEN